MCNFFLSSLSMKVLSGYPNNEPWSAYCRAIASGIMGAAKEAVGWLAYLWMIRVCDQKHSLLWCWRLMKQHHMHSLLMTRRHSSTKEWIAIKSSFDVSFTYRSAMPVSTLARAWTSFVDVQWSQWESLCHVAYRAVSLMVYVTWCN